MVLEKDVIKLTFIMLALLLSACSGGESIRPDDATSTLSGDAAGIDPGQFITPLSIDEQLRQLEKIKAESSFDFLLGKGDVLSVSVYNEADLSRAAIPVRLDGKISYPLVGDVQAEGLTVDQLKESLREKLTEYLHAPKVTVIVQSFASLSYTVAGEVTEPGSFKLVTDVTLTRAIATAGGLKKGAFHATSVELSDLSHAFISRNNQVLPIDFVQLLRNGDMRFDILLLPGDYIYIPSGLAKEIYVLGEVDKPDLLSFREGFSISSAIAQVNGYSKDANQSKVHVIRGSLGNPERYVINMKNVYKGKERDLLLEPGDIIYVPPTGLTSWSRIISKVVPSISAIQAGLILAQ